LDEALGKATVSASALEEGRPLPEPLAEALIRGTSIGGARPKALLDHHGAVLPHLAVVGFGSLQ
jgi:hypothetical protein